MHKYIECFIKNQLRIFSARRDKTASTLRIARYIKFDIFENTIYIKYIDDTRMYTKYLFLKKLTVKVGS
jgi:hypothetical protein